MKKTLFLATHGRDRTQPGGRKPRLAKVSVLYPNLHQSSHSNGSAVAGIIVEGSVGRARDFRRAGIACSLHSNL